MNCSEDELQYYSYGDQYLCGYTNILTCIIGAFFHTSIIVVYTRKNMISSMNTVLVHSSAVTLLSTIVYLPHSWHEFIRANLYTIEKHRQESWEIISLYSWHLNAVLSYTSTGIAIMMGVWRYIAVIHPLKERYWCNMRNTRIAIAALYAVAIVALIPAINEMKIVETYKILGLDGFMAKNCTAGNRTKIYEMKIQIEDNDFAYFVTFIWYGLLLKTLPSIFLGAISLKLILALRKAKNFRQQVTITRSQSKPNSRSSKTTRTDPTDRTTKMLLMILAIFIISELPDGIFCTLTAFRGKEFFHKYYYPSWELITTLVQVCDNLNFIVFYTMSNQFRVTFKALFRKRNGDMSDSPANT
ncbi:sex peptide receptor-related protein 2-like [Planococcus citri]|uniref:sex peptide receptor-related protein 2-like n=1 Tax=Planococcus citri TaxID=170843 RepID=UPI0031F77FB8